MHATASSLPSEMSLRELFASSCSLLAGPLGVLGAALRTPDRHDKTTDHAWVLFPFPWGHIRWFFTRC